MDKKYELMNSFNRVAARLLKVFVSTYYIYTGAPSIIYDHNEPMISSRFYIHKPKMISKKSNYTGYMNTHIIQAEIPSPRKNSYNEKIIILLTIFYDRKPVTKQHLIQRVKALKKYLFEEKGDTHYFIYFIAPKFRAGAYEIIKLLYKKMKDRAIIKALTDEKLYEAITYDIVYYLTKRAINLLESRGFEKSRGMIYSYPKKFIEYIILLTGKLLGLEDVVDEYRQIRSVREYPVDRLLDILYNIYGINKRREELRKEKNLILPRSSA